MSEEENEVIGIPLADTGPTDDIPALDDIPDLEIPDIDLEDFDIPEEEETAVEDESGGSQVFAWIGVWTRRR